MGIIPMIIAVAVMRTGRKRRQSAWGRPRTAWSLGVERLDASDDQTLVAKAPCSRIHRACRPVLMTATAMIIGMIPMALGLGVRRRAERHLGRAVIAV